MRKWRLYLMAGMLLAQVVFQERIALQVASGGRGALPLVGLLFPLLVLLLLLPQPRESLSFLRSESFPWIWMPVILCAMALPLFGILIQSYPARTLLTSWEGVTALAYLAVGAWGSARAERAGIARNLLLIGIVAQAALSFIQLSPFLGGFAGWGPIPQILDWDSSVKAAFSTENVVLGRGTGFYLNPNTLGVWGCLSFWASICFLTGWKRRIGAAGAILTILLSQSRGSLFALLASLLVVGVSRLFAASATGTRRRNWRRWLLAFGSVLAIAFGVAALAGSASQFNDSSLLGSMLDRFSALTDVISRGTGADANLQGRVDVWGTAWGFFQLHPFGTFGSPQYLLGQSLDNEFVRVLLQGSVLFLGAYLVLLLGGMRLLMASQRRAALFIGAASCVLAVNSVTATPLTYPAVGLYWVVVGGYLADSVRRRAIPRTSES